MPVPTTHQESSVMDAIVPVGGIFYIIGLQPTKQSVSEFVIPGLNLAVLKDE